MWKEKKQREIERDRETMRKKCNVAHQDTESVHCPCSMVHLHKRRKTGGVPLQMGGVEGKSV